MIMPDDISGINPNLDSGQPAAAQSPKKYILVAEDDKFYAKLFKVKLTNQGYEVDVASNGQQALDMARTRRPDLILLDLIMPVKDGYEALKELKADKNLKDVKVVVFSNLSQEEDIKKAMQLGANDFIVKTSISIQGMVVKVEQFLK